MDTISKYSKLADAKYTAKTKKKKVQQNKRKRKQQNRSHNHGPQPFSSRSKPHKLRRKLGKVITVATGVLNVVHPYLNVSPLESQTSHNL